MAIATTPRIGKEICEAMGLDASKVISLRLVFKPDSIVYAHVVQYVTEGEAAQIKRIVANYELRERKRL